MSKENIEDISNDNIKNTEESKVSGIQVSIEDIIKESENNTFKYLDKSKMNNKNELLKRS